MSHGRGQQWVEEPCAARPFPSPLPWRGPRRVVGTLGLRGATCPALRLPPAGGVPCSAPWGSVGQQRGQGPAKPCFPQLPHPPPKHTDTANFSPRVYCPGALPASSSLLLRSVAETPAVLASIPVAQQRPCLALPLPPASVARPPATHRLTRYKHGDGGRCP
ncbi:hypothetical protein KIL84_021506 [Mauremys mutica]|uniref:Uncharacterized protein n=1 Tax=Mauremys mutica TaxID=74926 RepID=A0A9D4ASZ8_9SAUR|nr:hypothetical protein KIL84_021506 [Mauremys mutica]